MKKLIVLLFALIGFTIYANAQYANITDVSVITSNGTFERSKVCVYYGLTSDGMKAVYDYNKDLKITISANYPINQFLKQTEKSDTFYPVDNGNGRRKNGWMLEFECIDHETARNLQKNGVSTSDFSISTSIR